ncbi:MAG: hypothetical protein ABR954_08360 [Dehalococcoidales bacterium]
MTNKRLLLVGDNPFHGISHLSQERAIARGKNLTDPAYAAGLVNIALDNGAGGFMFSVSNTTLSILKSACRGRKPGSIRLYAIVPYVFEFVRMAVTEGGILGLVKKVGADIITSVNIRAVSHGMKGVITNDPSSLLKAYLLYEETRIRRAAGKAGEISCIFLHEVLTDMAISLDMEWLFRTHIELMQKLGIKPGIHTHNLPSLVKKFRKWGIDTGKITLTTQFNSLGFGMTPSREECEVVLKDIPETEFIAYGVLASGYLTLLDAVNYLNSLPQLTGVAIGVSKEKHAEESFKILSKII